MIRAACLGACIAFVATVSAIAILAASYVVVP